MSNKIRNMRYTLLLVLVAVLLIVLGVYKEKKMPTKTQEKTTEVIKRNEVGEGIHYFEVKGVKIPVIYENNHILPMGTVKLMFMGGGNVMDKDKFGLSKLSASILNEGTKELGSIAFAEQLEQLAITLDADIRLESLHIDLSFLKEYQGKAISYLHDLLLSPNLTPSTLEKVQQRMVAAALNKESNFDYVAQLGLNEILFAGTPLAHPATGTPKSIKSISLEDVKKRLEDALDIERLIIVMGGDLDINKTLEALKPTLESLPSNKPFFTPYFSTTEKPETKVVYKDSQQAYIYFGSPFVMKDLAKELPLAKVMGFVLGSSGFGSRLMDIIRVKEGLAYSAYMRIQLSRIINCTTGYLQTKLENQDKSVALVKKVIKEFVEKGITQEELDGAKKFLLGSEPLANETISKRLTTKFHNFYLGLPINYDVTMLERIRKMTLEEINDYIKSHTEINDLSFSIVTMDPKNPKYNKLVGKEEKKEAANQGI
ncbi:Processing protease YmxG [Helicobacter ailurogastricus]|uniref:Putative PROCESSING PROTEASE n=2 Tax=Helicobacter ailurogastricus TaxID=1578720 RepID=A0A0K2X2H9_9HELI|nr:Processing protease YmxG [Helicobacter ailurogastricus]GLH59117.1 Processing protease YmxG [Helicobacter ailurogastricus]CRF40515.1 putative PROCESSING PROTEASE [Helicobacter ailurogastricus]CRF42806.1 putative PROCESSING PROTEASE [Helicobacter ailurogastricus]CRF44862.1 putative PROCESSING PROTEASE [Helicobacter ailurogastricus]